MSNSSNYLVNVVCPHCSFTVLCAISGYGGELAVRQKQCKKCGKEFFIRLLATTSIKRDVEDGKISAMKGRIRHLLKIRYQTLGELLLKHESARRLYQEALHVAEKMRESYKEN